MVACAEEVRRRLEAQRAAKERALQKGRAEGKAAGRRANVVEEESDDEEFAAPGVGGAAKGGEAGGQRFVWDAKLGKLVEASADPQKAAAKGDEKPAGEQGSKEANQNDVGKADAAVAKDATAAAAAPADANVETSAEKQGAEEGKDGEGNEESSEESSEEEEEEGGEVEAASRDAFLNDASTPELIKQAISVGGPMADGVSNRWVLDQATQLSFRYDTSSRQMYCWNSGQGCMYLWKERGKMDFLWASPAGPGSAPPASLAAAAAAAEQRPAGQQAEQKPGAEQKQAEEKAAQQQQPKEKPAAESAQAQGQTSAARLSLQVTVIPPEVLLAGGIAVGAKTVEEVEMSAKALAGVIGKGGASIQEIEARSGVRASALDPKEGEHTRSVRLEGTKAQIAEAKTMLEQKVVAVIGEKAAEKMQKHINSKILERKRAESGFDAAKIGVNGLSDFCQKWKVSAVIARKLARLDAQLQRYMIRHFKPLKAKPVNALRAYTVALLKQPQRWRLEALYEDGELDGEVCETLAVGEHGAIVGRQRTGAEADEPLAPDEQLIELEVNSAFGEQASRIYGDVQPQHCKLMRMGHDFYVWAQEAQIGTIVDGHKYRQHDGPVAIRDGSVLGVGKYLLYCEVGSADALQQRRKRLLEGDRLWKGGAKDGGAVGEAPGGEEEPRSSQKRSAEQDVEEDEEEDFEEEGEEEEDDQEEAGEEKGAEGDPEKEQTQREEKEQTQKEEKGNAEKDSNVDVAETTAEDPTKKLSKGQKRRQNKKQRRESAANADLPGVDSHHEGGKAEKRKREPDEAASQPPTKASAAPPRSSAAAAAAAFEAAAAAADGAATTVAAASTAAPSRQSSAAAAAAAYEAAAAASDAAAAPPRRSSAAAAAAAYEAAATVSSDSATAPSKRSSAAAAAAEYEASVASSGEQAAAAGGEEVADEEEEEGEAEDPMVEMLKQLGLPTGFN